MSRRTLSVAVLAAALLLVLWFAADVLLVVFAGILVAVFFRGGGNWVADRLGVGRAWGLAAFCIGLALVTALFLTFAGAALALQIQELLDALPSAFKTVRGYVEANGWLRQGIEMLDLERLIPSGSSATSAVSTTFGMVGNAVVIAFVGLYGAINPGVYVRGFTALLAPSLRPKGRSMLTQAGHALQGWLKAQFVSMSVVGVLTALGLWALGVPLALVLAVLAAALTFIPNIGPVLAAVPAVLLGLSEGPVTALWIALLYIAIQTIESYVITPRVQEESVSLPPALTISAQLLFGFLFGILGLALATPLAAVALRLGDRFYVREYLDREAGNEATLVQGVHR